MKKLSLFVLFCAVASATPVTVYNTGQNASHVVLAGGSVDPHYTSSGTVFVLSSPNGAWLANNSTSEWVGPDTGDGSSLTGGVYSLVYRTTVDLTGFNPATAVLQGRWSTDNSGTNISVNGTPTGNTAGTFNSWFTFTLNSGFVAGVNNIDFAWSNAGGPGGVRVEFTSATADLATSGVPEPASVLLTLTGAAALAFFKRRAAN